MIQHNSSAIQYQVDRGGSQVARRNFPGQQSAVRTYLLFVVVGNCPCTIAACICDKDRCQVTSARNQFTLWAEIFGPFYLLTLLVNFLYLRPQWRCLLLIVQFSFAVQQHQEDGSRSSTAAVLCDSRSQQSAARLYLTAVYCCRQSPMHHAGRQHVHSCLHFVFHSGHNFLDLNFLFNFSNKMVLMLPSNIAAYCWRVLFSFGAWYAAVLGRQQHQYKGQQRGAILAVNSQQYVPSCCLLSLAFAYAP